MATITSFTPTFGYAGDPRQPPNPLGGTRIQINGTDLGPDPNTGVAPNGYAVAVKFNGVAAYFQFDHPTRIYAWVPTGATTGNITVHMSDGTTATSGSTFTVKKPPYATSASPYSGSIGASQVITGYHFTGVTSVTFNGVSAVFTVDSDNQITTTIPVGATTGTVVITNPDGTSIFTYYIVAAPGAPTNVTLTSSVTQKNPAFSWLPTGHQTAFQIRVVLQSGGGDLYNTGKVSSPTAAYAVPWANRFLAAPLRVYVKTWNEADLVSTETSLNFTLTNAAPGAPSSLAIIGGTPTSDTTPQFTWSHNDTDTGDQQSAFQLRIAPQAGGADVYNSGKIASTTSLHIVGSALAAGLLRCFVKTWDQDDAVGTEAQKDFSILASLSNTQPTAPSIAIIGGTPQSDSTPSFTLTPHDPDVGDMMKKYKFWITRDSDSQLMYGSSTIDIEQDGFLETAITLFCTNVLAPGNYTAHAKTKDSFDLESPAGTSAFVIAASGDVTPPTITVIEPVGGSIFGIVRLRATVTDNVLVSFVRFKVDGALLSSGQLTASNYPVGSTDGISFYYDWDTLDPQWSLGSHTITVEAEDSSGNIATATIAVTLTNTIADLQRKLVTKQMPIAPLASFWNMVGKVYQKVISTLVVDTVASDDFDNYWIQPMIHIPGDSLNPLDYQLLPDNQTTQLMKLGATFRLLWLFTPLGLRTFFDTFTKDAIRFCLYTDTADTKEKLGILCRQADGTGKVLSWDGSILTTIRDLAGLNHWTPNDFAYFDGRWYVAMETMAGAPVGTAQIVQVIDPGDEDYALLIPTPTDWTTYKPKAIAVLDNKLWIGYDNGSNSGRIYYSEDGENLKKVNSTIPGVSRLYTNTGLAAGTSNGRIYGLTTSAATLLYDTTEAAVHSLLVHENVSYVGTGTAAQLHTNRNGSFALEDSLATYSEILALNTYQNKVFAGGDGNALWRRDVGSWTNVDTYSGVTAINDMVEYKGCLYLATSPSGRIYRREVSAVSGSGVKAKRLRAVGAEMTKVSLSNQ